MALDFVSNKLKFKDFVQKLSVDILSIDFNHTKDLTTSAILEDLKLPLGARFLDWIPRPKDDLQDSKINNKVNPTNIKTPSRLSQSETFDDSFATDYPYIVVLNDKLSAKVQSSFHVEQIDNLVKKANVFTESNNNNISDDESIDSNFELESKKIIKDLLSQLKHTYTFPFTDSIKNIPEWAQAWTIHYIKLQDLLIQLLYLVVNKCFSYRNTVPTDKIYEAFNFVISEMDFGRSQTHIDIDLDNFDLNKAIKSLTYSCTLFAISCFGLSSYINFTGDCKQFVGLLENSSICSKIHNLLKLKMNNSIASRNGDPLGPVLLAWGIFISTAIKAHSKDDFNHDNIIPSISATLSDDSYDWLSNNYNDSQLFLQTGYLDLKAIDCLLSFCKSKLFNDSEKALQYKRTLRDLVILLSESVDNVSELPNSQILSKFFAILLKDDMRCSQFFWDIGYKYLGCKNLLISLSKSFPLDTGGFLEFLVSSINSEDDASEVFDLLSNLNTYADLYRESDYESNIFERSEGFKLLDWKGTNILPLTTKFPYGPQKGTTVVELNLYDRQIVLHNWNYSGWYIFLGLIDSFLQANSNAMASFTLEGGGLNATSPGLVTPGTSLRKTPGNVLNDKETILDIENGNIFIPSVNHIIDILELYQRFFTYSTPNQIQSFIKHLSEFPGSGSTYKKSPEKVFISLLFKILACLSYSDDINLSAITICIKCITSLLPIFPESIWNGMLNGFVIQSLSNSSGKLMYKSTVLDKNVLPYEQEQGTYSVTQSYLELIQGLIRSSQIDNKCTPYFDEYEQELERLYWESQQNSIMEQSFNSIIDKKENRESFILKINENVNIKKIRVKSMEILKFIVENSITKIFPKYDNWRFRKIQDKYKISLYLLSIIDGVLSDGTWSKNNPLNFNPFKEIRELIFNLLLSKKTDFYVRPLIKCMILGVNLPAKFIYMSKFAVANLVEDSIALSLKIAGKLLQERMDGDLDGLCIFEEILLDSSFRPYGVSHDLEVVQIIGRYIGYNNYSHIQFNAVNLVSIICSLIPKWPKWSRPPSLAGYFGSDVFEFVNNSVSLIKYDGNNVPTELKVAVINMITLIVSTQAGLSSMFLIGSDGGIRTEGKSEELIISPSSLIKVLFEFLKKWKLTLKSSPRTLSTLLKLLNALWQNSPRYMGILDQLRSSPDFWDSLVNIFISINKSLYNEDMDIENEQDKETRLIVSCYGRISKLYILRIFAYEMYFTSTKHQSTLALNAAEKIISLVDFNVETSFIPHFKTMTIPELETDFDLLFHSLNLEGSLKSYQRDFWSKDFDVNLEFGRNYIYDFDLFIHRIFGSTQEYEKLVCSESTKDNTDGNDIPQFMLLANKLTNINHCYSFANAQLSLIKGWKTLLSITASRIPNLISANISPLPPQKVMNLLKGLTKSMLEISESSSIAYEYRYVASELISLLVAYCTGASSGTIEVDNKNISNLIPLEEQFDLKRDDILRCILPIESCMSTDSYPLGPGGCISTYNFHIELFMAALLSCQYVKTSFSMEDDQRLIASNSLCSSWIEHICKALTFLLDGITNNNKDIGVASIEILDKEFKGLDILLSSLTEIILLHNDLEETLWISTISKYNIIPSLLTLFSAYVFDLEAANPDTACRLLSMLKAFALKPISCAIMVQSGVFATLCNNSFSSLVSTMGVGTNINQNSERDPWSKVWLSMLTLVSTIGQTLGSDKSVIGELLGFIRMSVVQINKTLDYVSDWRLNQNRIEETVAIIQIIYCIVFFSGDGLVSAEFAKYLETADVGIRRKFQQIFELSPDNIPSLVFQGRIGLAKGGGYSSGLWDIMKPRDRKLIVHYVIMILNLMNNFIQLLDSPNLTLRRIVFLPRDSGNSALPYLIQPGGRVVAAGTTNGNNGGIESGFASRRMSILDAPNLDNPLNNLLGIGKQQQAPQQLQDSSSVISSPTTGQMPSYLKSTHLANKLGRIGLNSFANISASLKDYSSVRIYYFRKAKGDFDHNKDNSENINKPSNNKNNKSTIEKDSNSDYTAEQAAHIRFCISLATRNSIKLIKCVIE